MSSPKAPPTSDLVAALDRVSRFLSLLPRDLPEPTLRQFAGAIALDFIKNRSTFVTVSIRATGHLYWLAESTTATDHGWVAFDGATLPAEVLKAIRRIAL